MPDSYPVTWAKPMDTTQFTESAKLFMAARSRERERRRLAEQENYERSQAAVLAQRQAAADLRAEAASTWELENKKLEREKLGLEIKQHKFDASNKARKATLDAMEATGQEFLARPDAAQALAHNEAYFDPSKPEPAEPMPAGGWSNVPSAVNVPGVRGMEEGDPDIIPQQTLAPVPYAMARARAAAALKAQERADALAKLRGEEGVKAEFREPKSEWSSPETGPDGFSYQSSSRTGAVRRTPGVGRKQADQGPTEAITKDIDNLPTSWRDWKASYPTRDSFSVRNNEQATAIALANARGKILPTKKQGEATIEVNATISDIEQAQKYLQDPEVRDYVGKYAGKMTDFLAKGWLGGRHVPAKVLKFRATLNRLNAEERHRLYGAALTGTESAFAEGFLPGMDQSGLTLDEGLLAFRGDLERGMDAMWGTRTPEAPARSQGAPGAPQVGARKTFPNGKVGVWDGNGWVAQ